MKRFLLLLSLASCSSLDQNAFISRATGRYSLNTDGILFIRRELGHSDIPEGTTIEFRGNGDLVIIFSDTESRDFAQFIELKRSNEGIFRLTGTSSYVAMGYLAGSPLPTWLSTTNTFPSEDSVLLENILPIATGISE